MSNLCLLFIHPRAPNLISLRSAGRNRPCASSEARCSVRHGGLNAPVCDRMPAIGLALVFVQENAEQENARERAWRSSPEGLLPDPVLCQNSALLK